MSKNNLEKIKFITGPSTFEQPLFRYYSPEFIPSSSIVYGADGKYNADQNVNINSVYTRNVVSEFSTQVDNKFDNKYYPGFTSHGDPNLYAKNISIENEFKIPQYVKQSNNQETNITPKTNTTKSDYTRLSNPTTITSRDSKIEYKNDRNRSRNLDYSDHILPGSRATGGFGNIDILSQNKYGSATRDIQQTSRDSEIDRFHFTYRNYQHESYGSTPIPKDTRYLNKQL